MLKVLQTGAVQIRSFQMHLNINTCKLWFFEQEVANSVYKQFDGNSGTHRGGVGWGVRGGDECMADVRQSNAYISTCKRCSSF